MCIGNVMILIGTCEDSIHVNNADKNCHTKPLLTLPMCWNYGCSFVIDFVYITGDQAQLIKQWDADQR